MWQHSQICCHGMPQAVVLGTKRDRGFNCRGAILPGPGEQCSYTKRGEKVLMVFRDTPPPHIAPLLTTCTLSITHIKSLRFQKKKNYIHTDKLSCMLQYTCCKVCHMCFLCEVYKWTCLSGINYKLLGHTFVKWKNRVWIAPCLSWHHHKRWMFE